MRILDKIIKKKNIDKDGDLKKEKKEMTNKKETTENTKDRKSELKIDKNKKDKKAPTVSKTKKPSKERIPVHYFDVLKKPHISEKAYNLSKENKYVFVVSQPSNKSEIKKTVESLYKVSVTSVNIIKVPSKPKRFKGKPGVKSGYKKAIVALAKGSSIDIMKEK
jgi:large subunit ribosomal protein L23